MSQSVVDTPQLCDALRKTGHKVDLCRARIDAIGGKIDSVHSTLKLLNVGVGLALVLLAVIVGLGIRAAASGAWNASAPAGVPGPAPAASAPTPNTPPRPTASTGS